MPTVAPATSVPTLIPMPTPAILPETGQADWTHWPLMGGLIVGALAVGAVGCVAALANIAAARLARLLEHFREGDLAGARAIQLPLIEPNTAVTSRFGVPGLKAAMGMSATMVAWCVPR
jgi:dihydrodipicolinate synthase/N-acetylneuraminate lyase